MRATDGQTEPALAIAWPPTRAKMAIEIFSDCCDIYFYASANNKWRRHYVFLLSIRPYPFFVVRHLTRSLRDTIPVSHYLVEDVNETCHKYSSFECELLK